MPSAVSRRCEDSTRADREEGPLLKTVNRFFHSSAWLMLARVGGASARGKLARSRVELRNKRPERGDGVRGLGLGEVQRDLVSVARLLHGTHRQ